MASERVSVELEEPIVISTTLDSFRGWLNGYLKYKYTSAYLTSQFDPEYREILAYLRFGGQILIRVEHLSPKQLQLFFYADNIRSESAQEAKVYLENLKKDVVLEFGDAADNNFSQASITITIFQELLKEVAQLTYEDAQMPKGKELVKRIRHAINKHFGNDHKYAREFTHIHFYHSAARKRNRPTYFEQDKQKATGILQRILDEIRLEQSLASQESDFAFESKPVFGEPLPNQQRNWAKVFVLMPFQSEFLATGH